MEQVKVMPHEFHMPDRILLGHGNSLKLLAANQQLSDRLFLGFANDCNLARQKRVIHGSDVEICKVIGG